MDHCIQFNYDIMKIAKTDHIFDRINGKTFQNFALHLK